MIMALKSNCNSMQKKVVETVDKELNAGDDWLHWMSLFMASTKRSFKLNNQILKEKMINEISHDSKIEKSSVKELIYKYTVK